MVIARIFFSMLRSAQYFRIYKNQRSLKGCKLPRLQDALEYQSYVLEPPDGTQVRQNLIFVLTFPLNILTDSFD